MEVGGVDSDAKGTPACRVEEEAEEAATMTSAVLAGVGWLPERDDEASGGVDGSAGMGACGVRTDRGGV